MAEVKWEPGQKGRGALILEENNEKIGEMAMSVSGNALTVYHTEVDPKHEGKGFAKVLLEAMVKHARENKLQVVPLCPYVHAQFKRHPELYKDLWTPKEGS